MLYVLFLSMVFHTEKSECVSNIINIFLFCDLYLLEGLESAMVTQRWDTALYVNMLTLHLGIAVLV